jgi:hypothetical protein
VSRSGEVLIVRVERTQGTDAVSQFETESARRQRRARRARRATLTHRARAASGSRTAIGPPASQLERGVSELAKRSMRRPAAWNSAAATRACGARGRR